MRSELSEKSAVCLLRLAMVSCDGLMGDLSQYLGLPRGATFD
ncbi:hypothetical protein CF65_01989 [Aggregatibacter actinomycetemcomitans HK1651]|nr:hypothetical protein CF65_01989 [Aggregatibacter actinomycetemcomitans HK1651]